MSVDSVQDAADGLHKEGFCYCIIAGVPGHSCSHIFHNLDLTGIETAIDSLQELRREKERELENG